MGIPISTKRFPLIVGISLSLLLCFGGIKYAESKTEISFDRAYDISYNYTKTVEVDSVKSELVEVEIEEAELKEAPQNLFTYKKEFPSTIVVRITGELSCNRDIRYQLKELELKQYVKHVLATEWGHSWNEESLKAGAVAVKMYAMRAIEVGGDWVESFYVSKDGDIIDTMVLDGWLRGQSKWSDAHVYDCNYDMAYDPRLQFESTDRAVEETWNYVLVDKDGDLFRTHFVAWYNACSTFTEEGTCMGQWNSKADAENGMSWQEILEKYYPESQLILKDEPILLDNEPTKYTEYTVKSGDTISSITRKFYDSVDIRYWNLILRENFLTSTTILHIGTVLQIPEDRYKEEFKPAVKEVQEPVTVSMENQISDERLNGYVVKSGDTLTSISMRFYGAIDIQKIYEANRDILWSRDFINVGMLLTIPE